MKGRGEKIEPVSYDPPKKKRSQFQCSWWGYGKGHSLENYKVQAVTLLL